VIIIIIIIIIKFCGRTDGNMSKAETPTVSELENFII
jgi:hypothetical protein